MRGLSAIFLGFALTLAHPCIAAAWTDATVRTGRADVELLPDGRARVTLRIRVRVDGGWLEGLEIEGLDADAALDAEHPLTFRDAGGLALPVQVTPREDGRVSLRFTRRMAPRRGEYDVELAWFSALSSTRALEDGTLEPRWDFPAWRYGLDAVEIRWVVPEGTLPEPEDQITAPIDIEVARSADGVATITYRRAHLPRTSDWETAVRVPAGAWPHPAASSEPLVPHEGTAAPGTVVPSEVAPAAIPPAPRTSAWSLLAALVAVATWLKRRDLETRARRARREHRWLVPVPHGIATLVSLALLGFGVATLWLPVPPEALLSATGLVVAMAWQRSHHGAIRPRLAPVAPVPAREIARARRDAWLDWIGPAAWLEPTRLGGPAALGVLVLTFLHGDGPSRAIAALFAALVASGSRSRLGEPPAAALRALARAMERLRAEPGPPYVAVRLLGRGATDATDLRVHVSLAADGRAARLLEDLRVELALTEARSVILRASAREGTAAETALVAFASTERCAADPPHRARLELPVTPAAAGRELDRLLRGVLALAPRDRDATLDDDVLAQAAE